MEIPNYWAEHRAETPYGGRTRVIRRFGWSDVSEADAEARARQRVDEAIRALHNGEDVSTRERRRAYGQEGLPIREEVLVRNGNDVVTRNAYGARCLNQPDVLFVDIDVEQGVGMKINCMACGTGLVLPVLCLFAAAVLDFYEADEAAEWFARSAFIAVVATLLGHRWIARQRTFDNNRARALARAAERLVLRPGWRTAVYDTPAGLRLIGLHDTFDPASDETQQLFAELGTDRAYARMCALQNCFRARLTPKPWRMGLATPPGRGVWPVPPDRAAAREHWTRDYEAQARDYAACRYRKDLGDGPVHPRCAQVQGIHDELSRARSDLPIA